MSDASPTSDTMTPMQRRRETPPNFGPLLRHWRMARRMSQITLAADAEISARHLCFLETGRAHPSREMVQRLAAVLDVPLADRNALLLVAGYAPAWPQRALDAPDLEHIRGALDFILERQEPFPAIVMDQEWNIVKTNRAARRIFGFFGATSALSPQHARNVMHMICHPRGLRRHIVNWDEFGGPLMQTIHREAATGPNTAGARLRDELLAYRDMPARWKAPDPHSPSPPVLTIRLKKDDVTLAFFSTLTMLATPHDVMLEQLKIECFYPADTNTEGVAPRLNADQP